MAKKKQTLGKGKGKGERGKGKGENVGAGKMGKYTNKMVMVGHGTSNVPIGKMGKIFEDSTQQQKGTCKFVGILSFIDESIHVIHWLRATGLGAAWWCRRRRNTVRVRHKDCANNGSACCIARSRICRRLLLPATFTPSTSRQFNNPPFDESRSLPFCAYQFRIWPGQDA